MKDLHASKNACVLLLSSPKERDKMNARSTIRTDSSEIVDSPYYSSYKSFRPNCFECEKVAEIALELHASAVINQDTAIKKLEVIISMFAVNNVDRVFVTQDSHGNVFYMKFIDPDLSTKSTIVLGIYGIASVDATMYSYLQTLLQSKLIDLAAKAMSTILMRNNSISLQYLTYMKNSGYNSRSKKYKLPSYVSDSYLYAMIVKQVMLSSQCLTPIGYQSSPPRKFIHTEYAHPATLGYDFSSIISESIQYSVDDKFDESSLKGSRLKRSEHVESGDLDMMNENNIHPVFFGQSRRNIMLLKEDKSADIRRIIWSQNEFTFLYNIFPKEQKEKDAASFSKNVIKHIGHGLALVEVGLETNIHLKVGSKNSLLHDVRHLNFFLRNGGNIRLLDDTEEVEDSSIHGTRNRAEICQSIWLKVYPTMPMNDDRLLSFCDGIFEHALYLYCIERLSDYGRYYIDGSDDVSIFNIMNRYSSLATFTQSDVIRLMHEIQLQCPHPLSSNVSSMMSTGLHYFPCVLQFKRARDILYRLESAIIETNAHIRRLEPFLNASENIFSTSTEQIFWHIGNMQPSRNLSIVFGDIMQDSTSIGASEIRLIPDLDPQSVISDWLKKRHHAIEIVLSPTGLYFFYFNISSVLIRSMHDACERVLNSLRDGVIADERQSFVQIGVLRNEALTSKLEEGESDDHAENMIGRLSWEKKATHRLYLNISAKKAQHSFSLSNVDRSIWEKGLVLTQKLFPLLVRPDIDLFGPILEGLKSFCEEIDIDLISPSADTFAFLIAPIPNSNVIFITQMRLMSEGLLIVERMNDLRCIIERTSTRNVRMVPEQSNCIENSRSYSMFRQRKSSKTLVQATTEHRIVDKVRMRIFIEVSRALIRILFTVMANQSYLQVCYALETFRFVHLLNRQSICKCM